MQENTRSLASLRLIPGTVNNFPVVLFRKKAQPLSGCAFFRGVVLFRYYRAEGKVVAKKHNPEEKSTTAKGLRFFEEKYHREVIIVST